MRNSETVGAATEQRLDVLAGIVRALGLFGLFVLAGLAIGCAVAILRRSWAAIPTGAAIGLAAGGLALLVLCFHDLLDALERWTGKDIDGDGKIGGDGLVLVRARNTPADDKLRDDLATFLAGCAVDTSARRWEPELGRARYQQWRDMLINGGWAKWRSEDQRAGWELTATPAEIGAALG